MHLPAIQKNMDSYHFPQQKVRYDNIPFSHDLLLRLLDMVYAVSPPFTGYLKFADVESSLLFLFFFNCAPYSARKYLPSQPVRYPPPEVRENFA